MPPEWHPHQRTLMAWPQSLSWGTGWQQAESAYAVVANAISEFEPVLMLIPAQHAARCRQMLSACIELLPMEYDDAWARDSCPTFLFDDRGRQHALSWNFNGWGDRFQPWQRDRALAEALADHLNVPLLRSELVLEGGAVHVDGQGALLVTAQSLFDRRRNPDRDAASLQQELQSLTGSSQIILLPSGLSCDHTHGHVDELACFAAPGRVLLHAAAEDDPDATICRQAEHVLREHELDVVSLPAPQPQYLANGERLTLSYVNFYLANDVVLVPAFDQAAADADAAAIIAEQFPRRRVVACPALAIAAGGGGIHCITQQQPAVSSEHSGELST
jgi:agmatine deiminase